MLLLLLLLPPHIAMPCKRFATIFLEGLGLPVFYGLGLVTCDPVLGFGICQQK